VWSLQLEPGVGATALLSASADKTIATWTPIEGGGEGADDLLTLTLTLPRTRTRPLTLTLTLTLTPPQTLTLTPTLTLTLTLTLTKVPTPSASSRSARTTWATTPCVRATRAMPSTSRSDYLTPRSRWAPPAATPRLAPSRDPA
jgi:hypothetical protein